MDKVQLIKEEIERLKNHTLNVQKSTNGLITSVGRGRVEAFNDILKFIDSLSEEPGCEVNFTTKSDDLEEEINTFFSDWLIDLDEHKDFVQIAHHFAEWQKQKDKETIELAEDHAMLAGMNRMKEEMMENAIGTTIINDWQYGKDPDHAVIPTIHQRIEGFNVGDKVKIIIVKEE